MNVIVISSAQLVTGFNKLLQLDKNHVCAFVACSTTLLGATVPINWEQHVVSNRVDLWSGT